MDKTEPIDFQKLRLDGVYRMNERDELMLRIKIPAGVLSVEQGEKIAALSEAFAGGRLHLTTRGSIELHRVRYEDLPAIGQGLAAVGLTSRGACGGAVRGITCSTGFSANFALTQALARRLHRHFAGNPHFEGLPKKFKIAVEDGYAGARHLIQDTGIVLTGMEDGEPRYDVWVAGGLGREPQSGFLLESGLAEERLLPLVEAVVRTYRRHTPAGRRLKHLVNRVGADGFRQLLQQELSGQPVTLASAGLDGVLNPPAGESVHMPIFAGDLSCEEFRVLLHIAQNFTGGVLAVTADQNIALPPGDPQKSQDLRAELQNRGLLSGGREDRTLFRVCVGSHACRMGLSPTRDVTRRLLKAMPEAACSRTWAISGCPNSCSQPQLADIGVVTSRLAKSEDGERRPRFDLYRRTGHGLGEKTAEGLSLEELLQSVAQMTE